MNYIFYGLIVLSIIFGAINGKLDAVVNSILTGAELSVKVAFSLIGIMAFWLGIMKIAQECGFVKFIAEYSPAKILNIALLIASSKTAFKLLAPLFNATAFSEM